MGNWARRLVRTVLAHQPTSRTCADHYGIAAEKPAISALFVRPLNLVVPTCRKREENRSHSPARIRNSQIAEMGSGEQPKIGRHILHCALPIGTSFLARACPDVQVQLAFGHVGYEVAHIAPDSLRRLIEIRFAGFAPGGVRSINWLRPV